MTGHIPYDKRQERRTYHRFRARANCTFQSCDQGHFFNESLVCRVENISTGGFSFLSDQPCDIKSRLLITIALLDYYPEDPINAIGEIAWVKASDYSGMFRIGVRFVSMLRNDRVNLTHHLRPGTSVAGPFCPTGP
ncbi:MAG: PilZ domain-containing protein [bacterium]